MKTATEMRIMAEKLKVELYAQAQSIVLALYERRDSRYGCAYTALYNAGSDNSIYNLSLFISKYS